MVAHGRLVSIYGVILDGRAGRGVVAALPLLLELGAFQKARRLVQNPMKLRSSIYCHTEGDFLKRLKAKQKPTEASTFKPHYRPTENCSKPGYFGDMG